MKLLEFKYICKVDRARLSRDLIPQPNLRALRKQAERPKYRVFQKEKVPFFPEVLAQNGVGIAKGYGRRIAKEWQKDNSREGYSKILRFLFSGISISSLIFISIYYGKAYESHKGDEISTELRKIFLFKDRKKIANGCQKGTFPSPILLPSVCFSFALPSFCYPFVIRSGF